MNRLTVSILLSTIALCAGALVKPPVQGNFELLILHNNDMHARFEQTSRLSGVCTLADRESGLCYGGFPRVAHVVKEARHAAQTGQGPPVLYLNAGDTYTGTPWFTIYKWKIAAEFLNALQPDAVSLGNHEFDNGVSGLTPFIENLTSPVLCANLILTKVPDLAREANLKNSTTIDIDGHKVGIVGYLTPSTKFVAKPNDVEYIDEVVALREEVKKLQAQGIKIIIALGHSGYLRDQEIARDVEGLDLVIGGHTNAFLWNGTTPDTEYAEGPYPTYVTQASGRRVPVVQAYAYTKYLGKLHLTFDKDGEIIEADGLPILLDKSIPQDPQVLKLLKKYNDSVLTTIDGIVGNTSIVLNGVTCSKEECNLGNLMTDAMVERYTSDYRGEHWTDAPIAVIQAGSIRTSITHQTRPFQITKGDLLSVMPFEGNLTAVTMNGSVLLQFLEGSASGYNTDSKMKCLQVSGLKVVYNMKMPIGFRVVSVKARCWRCSVPSFTEVNEKSFYKVIMPSFLANGGDGYSMLSLGNHEFDNRVEGLIPFIRNVSSPVLAANLILDKVPALNQETNLRKSIILERDGVKIGIIGYLTAETKFLTPKNDVEYEDEVIAIRREVENLKKQHVNIFIALGHSGFTKDLKIARDVEDLDLVIGGHSNTFLWNRAKINEEPEVVEGPYPVEVRQTSGRIVRVVQAYAYTKYLGSLNIIFDRYGEIVHCEGNPILLNQQMPEDHELLKVVEKYSIEIDRVNNVVVGNSSVALHGEYCRMRECNMGVVIADSIVNYTKEHFDRYRDVNIAIVQGGRIRASIDRPQKPYEMTRGDWMTVLPFTDPLIVVTMNGSILLESLEHSVQNWTARRSDSPGQFLQFSGMRVVYDLEKPAGSRVVSAKAINSNTGELSDILEGNEYRVVMCLFLAEGGDGYANFEKLPKDILSYNEVDAVIYYLSRIGLLTQEDTGRLILLNTDKVKELQIQYHTNTISSSMQILSSKNLGMSCALGILTYFALEIYF